MILLLGNVDKIIGDLSRIVEHQFWLLSTISQSFKFEKLLIKQHSSITCTEKKGKNNCSQDRDATKCATRGIQTVGSVKAVLK